MKNAGLYGWEWWGDWSFSPSSHRHIKYYWTSFAVHILQPSRNAFYGMICKTCICCKHILPPEQWRSMKNRSPFFLWVNEIACWVRIFFELLLCYWPLLFELASSHKLHKICMIAFFGRRQHGADHCFIRMFAYVPTMCSFHLAEILRHFFLFRSPSKFVCTIEYLCVFGFELLFEMLEYLNLTITDVPFVHSYG